MKALYDIKTSSGGNWPEMVVTRNSEEFVWFRGVFSIMIIVQGFLLILFTDNSINSLL